MRFVQEASEPHVPTSLIGGQAPRLARPLLDVGPVPDQGSFELGDRLGEVLMADPPVVHRLRARHAEPLGDLGCAHELIGSIRRLIDRNLLDRAESGTEWTYPHVVYTEDYPPHSGNVMTRPRATQPMHLSRSPANKGRRYPPEVLTPEEIQALFDACALKPHTELRNRAFLAILYRTGLRCSEALALEPKDVDFFGSSIRVLHGKGDRARTVGIDAGRSRHDQGVGCRA